MGNWLTDDFIKSTIQQAQKELEEQEAMEQEKQKEEDKIMGESELQKADDAQEISGAIRGGQGDLNEDIKESEQKKKRKYTKRTDKDDGDKTGCKEKQQDEYHGMPEAVKEVLERELIYITEEQLRLEERKQQIVDFLKGAG